jgi:hypothetical protein
MLFCCIVKIEDFYYTTMLSYHRQCIFAKNINSKNVGAGLVPAQNKPLFKKA